MSETDKKRVEQDIVICLQIEEDGTRINGNFGSSKNLQDIIMDLCPDKVSSYKNPTVIYMRSEYHGEKLSSTDLKSLGILGGRALLRLINSNPESLKVQANVSAPLPQKPKQEEPEEKPKPRAKVDDSQAFQLKNLNQVKEVEKVVDDDKMEVDEGKSQSTEVESKVEVNSAQVEMEESKSLKQEPENQSDEPEPIINILDNRGTIIFSLDSIKTISSELPDSFFQLTEADVRMLYRDLRKEVDEIENAPLMTEELRKLEENKKILNQLSTYKNCAVRIQFPNRYVIQTKFSTIDTISSVMDFVKEFLINPDINFYLCKYSIIALQ